MPWVRRADLPVWRSLLFLPVNVDRYVRKAADSGPDAVVLDLAGSVALRDEPLARALVAEAASVASARGADVLVRINRPLDLAVRDIEDVVSRAAPASTRRRWRCSTTDSARPSGNGPTRGPCSRPTGPRRAPARARAGSTAGGSTCRRSVARSA